MTSDERKTRGQQAAWLLEQQMFHQALNVCALHYQTAWANTAPEKPQDREIAYYRFRAVHDIRSMLENFVEDGKRAEKDGDDPRTN